MSGFGTGYSFGLTGYNCGLIAASTVLIPAESLVLHYDISDVSSYPGTGATVTDLVGNSNATLYNGPTYSGGYLTFDGGNDALITNTSLASKVTTDITSIMMWAFPMDNGVLLSEVGTAALPNAAGWHDSQMEMVEGTMNFGMWDGAAILPIVSAVPTPLGAWYHFGMVYDGTKLDAYVNGIAAGSVTFNRQNPLEVGAGLYYAVAATDGTNMGDGSYANMRLGGMQVYNIALSSEQVNKLFNDKKNQYGL